MLKCNLGKNANRPQSETLLERKECEKCLWPMSHIVLFQVEQIFIKYFSVPEVILFH